MERMEQRLGTGVDRYRRGQLGATRVPALEPDRWALARLHKPPVALDPVRNGSPSWPDSDSQVASRPRTSSPDWLDGVNSDEAIETILPATRLLPPSSPLGTPSA